MALICNNIRALSDVHIFLTKYLLLYLKDTFTETERKGSFVCCSTAQITTMAGAGIVQNLELGASSRFSVEVQGPKDLGCPPLPS